TDLKECVGTLPSSAQLAAGLLQCMIATFERLDRDGFGPFFESWQEYDWLRGRQVRVTSDDTELEGLVSGIDSDGALCLQTERGMHRVVTGSIEKIGGPAWAPCVRCSSTSAIRASSGPCWTAAAWAR